ncbi:4-hydroxybenzoate octaprenyltransferase [Marinobacterium sp. AK62]|uniref:4-hydroxybenzoate octaprenyltransferase n=1 Tax=Marinobacterium alkalitolerans TaxID=1542925 RepID=A0ABS3Z637_9GAMM|nr:4-hydroxybenzoate octaprenyltransferase [Marinobacterium alkalitolerans]MBP0047166.1 4-hydroxybenzoate octaprenyltransferase [Marinobacterium alkalitolerans]
MQTSAERPLKDRLQAYVHLMRADRPIGTYLLLWPTLWAVWIAAEGMPPLDLLVIFCLGVFLTRSAGCVINDFADRHIDGHVKRTNQRPLPTGRVTEREAIGLFIGLMLAAFVLVLFTNTMTILMSFVGLALAFVYPFMKRYTHLPQLVLGAAFGWAIPMAFTAAQEQIPLTAWLLYAAKLLWTVAYDTQYAMVDRDDDLKIGVKSTAVLFGRLDKMIVGLLQLVALGLLLWVGRIEQLGLAFHLSLLVALGFFVYQQWLIRDRERMPCFRAFLNNHYAELAVLLGLILDYALT